MTTVNAFVATDAQPPELRANLTGTAAPNIAVMLRTWLALKLAFTTGGEIAALANNTPVTMLIKPWNDHNADAIALDVSADETGDGAARRYTLKALIDGQALRTMLNGKESGDFALQVTAGTAGSEGFLETKPLKITIITSYGQEDDAAPEPLGDAYYQKLKASITGAAVTANDTAKVIEINGGAAVWGSISGTLASQTDLASALNGKAASSHTHSISNVTGLQTALDAKAPLASPAFTGTPTAPTPSTGNNSTNVATTAFVKAAIDALINGAPGTYDTLKEIADQLAADGSAVAAITSALTAKAPLASPAFTGTPTAPTPSTGNNSTRLATTAFVQSAVGAVTAAPLTRGSASVHGHTSEGSSATSAPDLLIGVTSVPSPGDVWTLSVTRDGATINVTIAETNPEDGSVFIDSGLVADKDSLAVAICSALSSFGASLDLTVITVSSGVTGSGSHLNAGGTGSGVGTTGGGNGSDGMPASGGIFSIELLPGVSSKSYRMISLFVDCHTLHALNVRTTSGTSIGTIQGGAAQPITLSAADMALWNNLGTGLGLVLEITNDEPVGGTSTAWVIAELV